MDNKTAIKFLGSILLIAAMLFVSYKLLFLFSIHSPNIAKDTYNTSLGRVLLIVSNYFLMLLSLFIMLVCFYFVVETIYKTLYKASFFENISEIAGKSLLMGILLYFANALLTQLSMISIFITPYHSKPLHGSTLRSFLLVLREYFTVFVGIFIVVVALCFGVKLLYKNSDE